jgi:hypothetical protein
MPCRGNEAGGLVLQLGDTSIIALLHVRVQRLVRQEDQERLFPRALHEVHDVIRQHVGDVPIGDEALAIDVQVRIDRLTLALHCHPVRPAGPAGIVIPHVPLAEKPGLVAGVPHWNGERAQTMTRRITRGVVDDTVGVDVLPGQDRRPTR